LIGLKVEETRCFKLWVTTLISTAVQPPPSSFSDPGRPRDSGDKIPSSRDVPLIDQCEFGVETIPPPPPLPPGVLTPPGETANVSPSRRGDCAKSFNSIRGVAVQVEV
jgi:hypothetical protein